MSSDTITISSGSDDSQVNFDFGDITIDLGNQAGAQGTYSINDLSYSNITLPDSITMNSGTIVSGTYNTGPLTWGSSYPSVNITRDGMTMPEESDIKIGDKSLKEFMEKVEDRLAILKPNVELEEKWEQLRDLRRQYQELEKDILEKEKIMKILKED